MMRGSVGWLPLHQSHANIRQNPITRRSVCPHTQRRAKVTGAFWGELPQPGAGLANEQVRRICKTANFYLNRTWHRVASGNRQRSGTILTCAATRNFARIAMTMNSRSRKTRSAKSWTPAPAFLSIASLAGGRRCWTLPHWLSGLGPDHGCLHWDLVKAIFCHECRAAGRQDRNLQFTNHAVTPDKRKGGWTPCP
ncbi:hypothetical protein EOA32_07840 [Mesorhizobium sp. M1A.F.Ca.ET.072.01.1.1]|uniref:hypothetical protein n=1 Tax=Mesorhizobium sp. M1A.F.Ca.ET.072.01.1.1 TaxID=2496753 RepID=UPI000FD52AB3|nr:hypothetical protein [Mesorhizobium sp. M1A.F.Ca.ET.072.01.1.1]RUW53858.1 hypothetical protein EOA32_07840 [Mesorhizobium sp. M1A.F.Ca.ET.072.01.1.1]